MRRREFISFTGGVAFAWSLGARAQEPGRVYRIAIVLPVGRDEAPNVALFDELRRLGFVEGQNLQIIPGFLTTNEQVAEVVPAMWLEATTSPERFRRRHSPYLCLS
jgi:hypothetical protein